MSNQIKSNQIKSNQIKSNHATPAVSRLVTVLYAIYCFRRCRCRRQKMKRRRKKDIPNTTV
jgi:hypothetical protein